MIVSGRGGPSGRRSVASAAATVTGAAGAARVFSTSAPWANTSGEEFGRSQRGGDSRARPDRPSRSRSRRGSAPPPAHGPRRDQQHLDGREKHRPQCPQRLGEIVRHPGRDGPARARAAPPLREQARDDRQRRRRSAIRVVHAREERAQEAVGNRRRTRPPQAPRRALRRRGSAVRASATWPPPSRPHRGGPRSGRCRGCPPPRPRNRRRARRRRPPGQGPRPPRSRPAAAGPPG